MSKKIIGGLIAVLMVVVLGSRVAFAGTAEVDILVIPGGISTTLTANPTYYDFGTVNLSVSSNSVTGISLTNEGNVNVALSKQATNETGVIIVTAAPAADDEFRIWTGTSAVRIDVDAWDAGCAIGTGATNLTGAGSAAQIVLGVGLSCTNYFQIDMPPTVTISDQRFIDITFTSTQE